MTRRIDLWSEERLRLSESRSREELRADIVRASCLEGDFRLAAGVSSRYYFDKYMFETRPALLRRLGRLLAALVQPGTERLAAQSPGALALGVAVSLETGLPLVILRPAEAGEPITVEGELYDGEQVTLIEDVVVTGTRALEGIGRLRDAGAELLTVVAVVEREHGARARLEADGMTYRHLFTSSELGIVELPGGRSAA